MTDGLIPIAIDQSLVAVEEMAAAWIDSREDRAELDQARTLLAAWRRHYARGSDEAEAARRLDLRAERRIGALLPVKVPGPVRDSTSRTPDAERQAESRARALAAVPAPIFEEELAKPKPSRDRIVARAIVDHQPDPGIEESRRLLHVVKGPRSDSWPHLFDVDLLDAGAIATVEETIDTWAKWSAAWRHGLAERQKLRRVR